MILALLPAGQPSFPTFAAADDAVAVRRHKGPAHRVDGSISSSFDDVLYLRALRGNNGVVIGKTVWTGRLQILNTAGAVPAGTVVMMMPF